MKWIFRAVLLADVLGGPFVQWLVFQPGNFSDAHGAVYLPLGEHGIYTSRALGIAWYSFVALALGLAAVALFHERRKRRRPRP